MIEVLKQALDALECGNTTSGLSDLRQVIAELESQEPVDYEKLAALGWQAIECGICGGGAMGYPQRPKVVFPTMLRKMWSGGEVQAWLDENVNKEKNNA